MSQARRCNAAIGSVGSGSITARGSGSVASPINRRRVDWCTWTRADHVDKFQNTVGNEQVHGCSRGRDAFVRTRR